MENEKSRFAAGDIRRLKNLYFFLIFQRFFICQIGKMDIN